MTTVLCAFVWWVSQYLQKVAHSPLCLSQSVQANAILPAASSQSWTLGVGEPEGGSSWLDSWSSNTHNEMLQEGRTESQTLIKRISGEFA